MSWIIIIEDVIAGLSALGPIIKQILDQIQSTKLAPPSVAKLMADAPVKTVTFTISSDGASGVKISVS